MKEVSHRAHHRANLHGANVLPATLDVADDPLMQATIRRLGENVDVVSADIDRVQYVTGVAAVVRAARAAR